MALYQILHFDFIEQYHNPLTSEKVESILRLHIIKTDNSNVKTLVCRNIQYLPLALFVSGHGKYADNLSVNMSDRNSFYLQIKSEESNFGRKIVINCDRIVKEIESLFPQLIVKYSQTGLIIEAISRSIEESIISKRLHLNDYGSIVILKLNLKHPDTGKMNMVGNKYNIRVLNV